jgi:hypothetical protein
VYPVSVGCVNTPWPKATQLGGVAAPIGPRSRLVVIPERQAGLEVPLTQHAGSSFARVSVRAHDAQADLDALVRPRRRTGSDSCRTACKTQSPGTTECKAWTARPPASRLRAAMPPAHSTATEDAPMNTITHTLAAACLALAACGANAADAMKKDDPMAKDAMMKKQPTLKDCKDAMAMEKHDGMKKDDAVMKKDSDCADRMKKDAMMAKEAMPMKDGAASMPMKK